MRAGTECERAQLDEGRRLLNADQAIGELVNTDGVTAFEGYWKNDEANAKRTRGGVIWMGDRGYRDTDGYFYFVGLEQWEREFTERGRAKYWRLPEWLLPYSSLRCTQPE